MSYASPDRFGQDPHAIHAIGRGAPPPEKAVRLMGCSASASVHARQLLGKHANNFNAVDISIPAAVTVFPGEIYQAPRTWTERSYHRLIYFDEVSKGGHFAAWEQPQLFAQELRAVVKNFALRCSDYFCLSERRIDRHLTRSVDPPLLGKRMSAFSARSFCLLDYVRIRIDTFTFLD
jgi:hypothetical protein